MARQVAACIMNTRRLDLDMGKILSEVESQAVRLNIGKKLEATGPSFKRQAKSRPGSCCTYPSRANADQVYRRQS